MKKKKIEPKKNKGGRPKKRLGRPPKPKIEKIKGNFEAFRHKMTEKELILLEDMLNKALKSKSISIKAQVLNASCQYRRTQGKDVLGIIERVVSMDKKQLVVYEAELRQKKIIDDVGRGKATLHDVYKLPQVNKYKENG